SDTARTQLSSFATRSLPIADAGLPTCLVVLGMHRSGTSALTRVLSLLGSALPKTLMPPIPDNNITGFWESAPLAALNDRFLAEVGSRWDDWRAFPAGMLPPDLRARYLAQLAALITEEFGAAPLAILKDPRICRLASFYMDVLKGMGIRPLFVIPLRNPLAVSASLGRRDGMSSGFAQLLWLRHVLDAEAITRASRRAVVSYEALLMDWPKAVHLIGVRLGLDWPRSLNEARPEIEAFLSTEHQHFAPSRWEVAGRDDVPEWVKGTYENMLRLEKDPDDELAVAELDRIRAEFDSVCASVGAAMMEEVAARERRFQGERQQLAAQATELRTLLGA